MAISPLANLVTQRPDLDQSFLEFPMAMMVDGFIARQAAPIIDVDQQAGNLGRIPVAQLLTTPDIKRSPRSGYRRTSYDFTADTYNTIERGIEEVVDETEVAMYGNYFNVELIAAMRARRIVLQDYEIECAAALFNTTTFAGALTAAAANQWSARSTATIRDDVTAAKNSVFKNSGFWPNAAIMSAQLFNHLVIADDITTILKFSGIDDPKASNVTKQAVAQLLNLDFVLVAGQAKNSADEGQTFAAASVWDPTMCLVARIVEEDNQDYREVCVARTVHWAGAGSSPDGTSESYPAPDVNGEVVRVRTQRQVVVRYANAGFLITGCAPAGG